MAATPTPSNYGTVKEAYTNILIELVKEESPTLYVEDFLYYFNKSISEYLKVRYELFEITQQLTDDLRFWKKEYNATTFETDIDDILPYYRHLLNCIVGVKLIKPVFSCGQSVNTVKRYKATRLTSDVKAAILNNSYLEAMFYRPYFDILDNTIRILVGEYDESIIKFSTITIEYLKQPEYVTIDEAEIKATNDTSQVLEFSKDVGDEINKIALKLILERGSDQRLQSHIGVNQAINDPSIKK